MKVITMTVVIALAASAAIADLTPVPDGVSQTLSDGLTYRYGATVTYTPSGDAAITILFGAGPTPPARADLMATVLVDADVADSPFIGDYIARSINTIQFGMTSSGRVPGSARLQLKTANRSWAYEFKTQVSAVAGEEKTVIVPLASSGWTCNAALQNRDAAFAQDLQNIASVAIMVFPSIDPSLGASPEQSYTIANCVLVNDDGLSSKPGSLTPLEKALLARFGFGYGAVAKLTDAMKTWDADGDGMFDFMEIWSENDNAYAASIFAAHDIQVGPDGVDITWTCVKGDSYTVLSSSTLGGTFSPVSGLSGVAAADTGFMSRKDVSAAGQPGPFYYRIRKD